jgi:predicted RNA-binding Zn-ribbon protein involved in translation (DUF1610 family)
MAHSRPNASDSKEMSRRKSLLFCQDCGHESPVDGDWVVQPEGDHCRYVCPTCQHVLTARPRDDVSSTTVVQFTSALVRFWLTPAMYWHSTDDPYSVDPDAGAACCA